jgi:hypothetical protein
LTGNKKIEVEEKKAKYVEAVKEKNRQAVKAAAQAVRTEAAAVELATVLGESGEDGLEEKALNAFNQYKASAQAIATSDRVSEKQRLALEAAKNTFEAIKKAKQRLLIAKEKDTMVASLQKQEGRLEEVKAQVAAGMDGLDRAARLQEEFPEDERANTDLEVAEARLDALTGAGEEVLAENAVAAEEETAVQDIVQEAKEQRAYNRLWLECKTLFTSGETDELALMMETIREAFEEKEQAYKAAAEAKAENAPKLGAELDKALITYNASLNIQFDLEEMRDQAANKIDLELSDEMETEIRETV